MKEQKEIRKEKREECINFFKEKEIKARKIFFECFTGLLISILVFFSIDKIIQSDFVYNIFFYLSGLFVALFTFLSIKWIREIIFQKRMQIVSRLTFEAIEKELEKFD